MSSATHSVDNSKSEPSPITQDTILALDHVDLGYGTLQVVFDNNLRVNKGELIGLVGGNGSGKSTILRSISGMIKPMKGRILFQGKDVGDSAPFQMARLGLAHVPMGRQLFPNLTVKENLLMGAYLPDVRTVRLKTLEEIYSLFPDLVKFESTVAGALSGGQQQMVAIGRGLMLKPAMLLLDEPSLGLSPLYVKEVLKAIRRVAETGMPVLLVEQNIKQVLKFCHRTYVLENGRQVLEGPSALLEDHPIIRKAYLGL